MSTLSDHSLSKSPEMRRFTFAQRVITGTVIGVALLIGTGFWAYRGSVVFTELVDLALAYCF